MSSHRASRATEMRTPAETAAYWLLRANDEMEEGERAKMNAWLDAEPEHRAAFERARAVWQTAGRVTGNDEVRAMRAAALAVRPERSRIFRPALAAGIAALAIAVGGGFVLSGWSGVSGWPSVGSAAKNRYTTAIGERLSATLQDGSTLALNTDSQVDIDFAPAERRIHLRRGQALFEVAKDARRPFVVYAADRRITALGTAFDVRVDDAGAIRVLLVEGRVVVSSSPLSSLRGRGQSSADGNPSREAVELGPGEQLTAAPASAATVGPADIPRLTSWRSGRLVFQDETLSDAVAELNRYTQSLMVIDDPRVAALRVSAVFRISQADRFANSMTELFPLVAVKQPDGSIHLKFSTPSGED